VFDVLTVEKNLMRTEHWWVFDPSSGKRLATMGHPYYGQRTGNSQYTPPKQEVLSIHPPEVSLQLDRRWAIPLAAGLPPAYRDLRAFDFYGNDRIVGVRQVYRPGVPVGDPSIVVADLSGKILFEVPVKTSKVWTPMMAHTSGSTFIFAFRSESPPMLTNVWSFDAVTGKLASLGQLTDLWARRLVGFADGCYVLQGLAVVRIYDSAGKLVPTVGRHPAGDSYREWLTAPGEPSGQFAFADVAVDGDQHLVVASDHSIHWYDEAGKHLRMMRTPGYGLLSQMRFMPSGELWAVSPIGAYKIDPHTGRIQTLHPAFSDHRVLDIPIDLRSDARGLLWVSNAEGIFPMQVHGRLGSGFGSSESASGPSSVYQLFLTPGGSALALDAPTANIFCYGSEGTLLHIAKPIASDFAKWPLEPGIMTATQTGNI